MTKNITQCAREHPPIILAVTEQDGLDYSLMLLDEGKRRPSAHPSIVVTPRMRHHVRGRFGPVYATPKAMLHPSYPLLLHEAIPAGIICTCEPFEVERVA